MTCLSENWEVMYAACQSKSSWLNQRNDVKNEHVYFEALRYILFFILFSCHLYRPHIPASDHAEWNTKFHMKMKSGCIVVSRVIFSVSWVEAEKVKTIASQVVTISEWINESPSVLIKYEPDYTVRLLSQKYLKQ